MNYEEIQKKVREGTVRDVNQERLYLGLSWDELRRACGASDEDVADWKKGRRPKPIFERIMLLMAKKKQRMIEDFGQVLPSWYDYLRDIIGKKKED